MLNKMDISKRQMKLNITAAVHQAISSYFNTNAGSLPFGIVEITQPTDTIIQISSKTRNHGLVYFEIKIKEAF